MKNVKKCVGLLLALVMVFTLAVPAFGAADTYKVTIPEGLSTHTFVAYQIFTGTQAESEGTLGDAKWGSGIQSEDFLAALKGDAVTAEQFADCATALDVVSALDGVGDTSEIALRFAQLAYENKSETSFALQSDGTNHLPLGYYLIVDTTDLGADADDAKNSSLLQVTSDVTISVKTDKPSVEKKVKEDDKYTANDGYGAGYNDVADYDIGDAVPFAFYSKAPDMTYYETYRYVFHDVMSAGLTLNADSIVVTVGGETLTKGTHYIVSYTEGQTTADGCTFEIVIGDLKTVPGATTGADIRVDFTATLNEGAEIGLPGNPNKVRLEYSNNPDESGAGDEDNTGKTPWDEVIVFTYELQADKVDGKDETTKLQDAQFILLSSDKTEIAKIDGEQKFDGWVDLDQVAANADGTYPADYTLTSDENGFFHVSGLDDGTYYLRETKAPVGYNILTEDLKIVITASTTNGQNWTDGDPEKVLTALAVTAQKDQEGEEAVDGTTVLEGGTAKVTIANNSGATLPETGGVGTTIFYAMGGILVVTAVVLLVTKKRMSAEN